MSTWAKVFNGIFAGLNIFNRLNQAGVVKVKEAEKINTGVAIVVAGVEEAKAQSEKAPE